MNNERENQNKTLSPNNESGPQIDIDIPSNPLTSDTGDNQIFDLVLVDMVASYKTQRLVCVKRNMYQAGSSYKYVCVSYRWGEYNEQIALTPDYNAHVTSFGISDLINLCTQILYWNYQEHVKEHGIDDEEEDDDDDDDDDYCDGRPRFLWVDAISVDQMDHSHKKTTVHRMKEIYARAEMIIAVPDLHIAYLLKDPNSREYIITLTKNGKRVHRHITLQCMNKESDDNEDDIKNDQVGQENIDVQEQKSQDESNRGTHKHRGFRQFFKDTIRQSRLATSGHDGNKGITENNIQDPVIDDDVLFKSDDEKGGDTQKKDDDDGKTTPTCNTDKESDHDHQKNQSCLCDVGMSQIEKEDYNRALTYLKHVVDDWANRVWVISECSIGRRSKMKLWFLSIGYYLRIADRPSQLLDLFNEERPTIFDQPLKERSFLDMMLNSNATRNEDRFYAILPLFKEFKPFADNHDISNWGITDMLSVRLQLFRMVNFQEKLAILLSCTIINFSSDVILPSFASNYNHYFFNVATGLSYKTAWLKDIELLKDEDINRDYLRITVPWSRTFTDTTLSHDLVITKHARGKLGLDASEVMTVFIPIVVHDERTNHTMGVKLLGNRQKNIWVMLNRMMDLVDVPPSDASSNKVSVVEHHTPHRSDSLDMLWSDKHENDQVFHLY
ncbi:uncharacterized protein BX664DRAFT_362434 [Halteromyces radiatus]|uniref:uncharacterized protein n=1 Tax=Halteromyces radiatus TaxID=101107 RepID=UPI00221EC670|nr:uncharacterized protein BX664DRAFT_362434 [Halteromyces radiatus]KAI8078885.1 hypothetical protein BX664DRAFT_362434 [Halteromyces radiatus]